jgi:hypothetical protein
MLWSSKTRFESATHLLAWNVISRRNECMIVDCNSDWYSLVFKLVTVMERIPAYFVYSPDFLMGLNDVLPMTRCMASPALWKLYAWLQCVWCLRLWSCLDKLHKADQCAGWWLSVQCQIRLRARGEVHCDGGKQCMMSKKEKNAQCCTGKLSWNSRMDLWFTSVKNVEQHALRKIKTFWISLVARSLYLKGNGRSWQWCLHIIFFSLV